MVDRSNAQKEKQELINSQLKQQSSMKRIPTTEIFCGAEQHIVGLHSHILKILDLCCEAAETQLEYAEISKYFRQIKCQNSRYNSIFAFTFKKVENCVFKVLL